MRDAMVYQLINGVRQEVAQVLQSLHLQLSGETIRSKALEKLLTEKGLLNEDDLKKKMAEVIKELNDKNNRPAEDKKAELRKPTKEEIAKVEESTKQKPE